MKCKIIGNQDPKRVSPKKGDKRRPNFTKIVKLALPIDYPWKVLQALAIDLAVHLSDDENALLSQIVRGRDLSALMILAGEWGLQNNSKSSAEGASHISKVRAKYQLSALLKKFRFETDKDKREANATRKFIEAEAVCQDYNHSGYKSLAFGETESNACIFTYARSFLSKVLGENCLSKDLITRWSRHGPGSNLDTLKGQSSVYLKNRNWPYSCTSAALPFARFLISTDKRWLGFLEDSYRSRNNIPKNRILDQEVFWSSVFKVVKGNRIFFVPKDAITERSIAIEPTMNLMLQLGVDGHIRSRLKRWDIDLDDQTKNQRMAFRGSIDPTDESYVTLDLANASDSISLKLCEMLLPSEWYSYLCKLRSPSGQLGNEVLSYNKISSMGNGFTFALESAIFAALSYGAIQESRGSCDFKNDLSVFGDDLIVRKSVHLKVIRALNLAGFTLNSGKSFTKGFTRESCGTDWIEGLPVRPVFFTDTPTDVMELFVDRNRLKRILSLRWGVEESKTVALMDKWIPEKFRDTIGPTSDIEFDSYLHRTLPLSGYNNGVWKYKRLIRQPLARPGKNFLCRKLMHDLRGPNDTPLTSLFTSRRKKISTGGSRFTVLRSYSYKVSTTFSATDFWSSSYAEVATEVNTRLLQVVVGQGGIPTLMLGAVMPPWLV